MDQNTKILGHRGIKGLLLENTFPSFKESLNCSDGFELDLWLSKDNILIINHDSTFDRLAYKDNYYSNFIEKRQIKELYWDEIEKITLIDSIERKYKVLRLDHLLQNWSDLQKSDVLINLEVKDPNCSTILGELLKKMNSLGIYQFNRFLVSSYHPEVINHFFSLKTQILTQNRTKHRFNQKKEVDLKENSGKKSYNLDLNDFYTDSVWVGFIVDSEILEEKKCNSLITYIEKYEFDYLILGKELLSEVLDIDLDYKIGTFTVNELNDIQDCKIKLDLIISDRPDKFTH